MIITSNVLTVLWTEWISVFNMYSVSASVSLLGILTLYYSSFVPQAFQRLFRYGKTAESSLSDIKKLHKVEIPKRWFYHFYLFAFTFYILLSWSVCQVYILRNKAPAVIAMLLDSFVGHRRPTVSPISVILAMILLQIQVSRRLYECTLLSIYSDAKMNIFHYICGFSFYFGAGLSLIAEAPGFSNYSTNEIIFSGDVISLNHLIGVTIFFISSYIQLRSHAILASLRKDSAGRIITYKHSIPNGYLFELVSCPHYFAEILIYLSLSLVLSGRSTTWWMTCSFVIANQVIVGLFNHQWYLDNFEDYPKIRKAVIPFLI